ncbi:MAG TPA: MFS transporter [Verrucomicrobiae bacterium]|jgi:predicted MFS family arabinose efflux permease|nr:MFS transporter [Verrucomicrobiae bacterium]
MKQLSERTMLLLLAAVQFTHIVDFMLLMPLGPQLMRDLHIGPGRFSSLVAAYTISSGVFGLLAAPFIDRFDRRKLLLFAYGGFIGGTLFCALSVNATTLLIGRGLSGTFGGLSLAMVMSIIGDVVPPERRASAMGVIMAAFSAAAALGVPFGLQLAEQFRWEAPFFMLAGIAMVVWTIVFLRMPSVSGHLHHHQDDPLRAIRELLRDANAGRALLFMTATVFGHFVIIPLLSPYLVGNVGLPEKDLFLVYFTGGMLTVFSAPLVGRLADSLGSKRVFIYLVAEACVVTLLITTAPHLPVWVVLMYAGGFFVFASGRFIPGQAIMTLAVPASRRGAFMSLSGCARDLAMGFASSLGGWVVTQEPSGRLHNFNLLGWLAVAAAIMSVWLAARVRVNDVTAPAADVAATPEAEISAIEAI